jgi:hypothetical protein
MSVLLAYNFLCCGIRIHVLLHGGNELRPQVRRHCRSLGHAFKWKLERPDRSRKEYEDAARSPFDSRIRKVEDLLAEAVPQRPISTSAHAPPNQAAAGLCALAERLLHWLRVRQHAHLVQRPQCNRVHHLHSTSLYFLCRNCWHNLCRVPDRSRPRLHVHRPTFRLACHQACSSQQWHHGTGAPPVAFRHEFRPHPVRAHIMGCRRGSRDPLVRPGLRNMRARGVR